MRYKYLYLSGPMTGLPKHNYPVFNKATKKLRKKGFKVINPAELDGKKPLPWSDCLRRDLTEICKRCYAIATIAGWKHSRGATLEVYVAKELDMPVHTVQYWLEKGE
jgi:hypothetical protein